MVWAFFCGLATEADEQAEVEIVTIASSKSSTLVLKIYSQWHKDHLFRCPDNFPCILTLLPVTHYHTYHLLKVLGDHSL